MRADAGFMGLSCALRDRAQPGKLSGRQRRCEPGSWPSLGSDLPLWEKMGV